MLVRLSPLRSARATLVRHLMSVFAVTPIHVVSAISTACTAHPSTLLPSVCAVQNPQRLVHIQLPYPSLISNDQPVRCQ